nr:uncharacterized protein LOC111517886 [Leptinotarsa decemlineata]
MDAFRLSIYVWMNLKLLQDNSQLLISDVTIDVPKILNDPSIAGSLILRDVLITGLETIDNPIQYSNKYISVVATEVQNNFNVCVTIPIQYMNVTTKYIADIAIRNEIPIYGEGNFTISLSNITINTCMLLNYNSHVDHLDFQMVYNHGPVHISGVLKHRTADKLADKVLEIANILFAMWNKIEPKETSCLMSPLMEYFVNWYFIQYENRSLEFNWACLENSSFMNILGLFMELKEDVLNILLSLV